MSPPSSGSEIKLVLLVAGFMLVSFLAYFSTPEIQAICSSETSVFTGIQSVIYQTIEFFLTLSINIKFLGNYRIGTCCKTVN
jgi:hypothetical protein